jgi:hypothetical protein
LSKLRTPKKRGVGRPRNVPSNPDWKILNAVEQKMFETIPARHNHETFTDLLSDVRIARNAGDEDQYVDALTALFQFHYDSFDPSEAFTPIPYKGDDFLSARGTARVNAKFLGLTRSGTAAKTVDQAFEEAKVAFRTNMPKIDYFNNEPGWEIQGAKLEGESLKELYSNTYKKYNLSDSEVKYRAAVKAAKDLNDRSTNAAKSFIRVVNTSSKHEIHIHMDTEAPAGSLVPKASLEDVKATLLGIRNLQKGGLYKEAVKINLLSEKSLVPADISSQLNDKTIGFTYSTSDFINLYVQRLNKEADNIGRPDSYWSTDITTRDEAYSHVIAHEAGHKIQHRYWGGPTSNGESELLADISKYGGGDYEVIPDDATPRPADVILSTTTADVLREQFNKRDVSNWTQTGPQAGSNPGGTYTDPVSGDSIYLKVPKSQLHGENERLAAAFYNLAGIGAVSILPGNQNGADITYSHILPGSTNDLATRIKDPKYLAEVQRGFAMDAWLANWDVIGASISQGNILTDANGTPVRVDPGGSLLFRAQGAPKGTLFSDTVIELDSFVDKNSGYSVAQVFGDMTQQQKVDSAAILQQITPQDIDSLVDQIISDPVVKAQLQNTLKNRRDDILTRLGLDTAATPKPAAAAPASTEKSIRTAPISGRGADHETEDFAELFAKYALTGEAPEWFRELLKSKGLTKRQISKKWREGKAGFFKKILDFLDLHEEELQKGSPEDADGAHGFLAGFGPKEGHKIARWLGFQTNKPELVDKLDPALPKLFRGISPHRNDSAKDLMMKFVEDDVPYYSSTKMYGDGLYAATDRSTASGYSSGGGVLNMAIKPEAKIYVMDQSGRPTPSSSKLVDPAKAATDASGIDVNMIDNALIKLLQEKVQNEMFPDLDLGSDEIANEVAKIRASFPAFNQNGSNYSNIAGLLGFDGIEIIMGGGTSYFTFFNRGVLQVEKF